MTKKEVVRFVLLHKESKIKNQGDAFAPANIALCKYWGKRNNELNLPLTSSLSISLCQLGSSTKISLNDDHDIIFLNDKKVDINTDFAKRISSYLNLFRSKQYQHFTVKTTNTIPTAAGLASSASGFAALICALDDLLGWNLDKKQLSILARLGSGSACRSIYEGFVEWHAGKSANSLDSFAEPLPDTWPDLCLGLIKISEETKPVSSRSGMKLTTETSELYKSWPQKVKNDLKDIKTAIKSKNFKLLGETAESNALAMHATMINTWPPILYWLPESVATMHKIWHLRQQGLSLYFTMDAGPNIKLLFQHQDIEQVQREFPGVEIISPFASLE